MVWAKTDRLGCGQISYRSGKFTKKYLVCNYGEAGNFLRSSVYEEGTACSDCPRGLSCSADYPGLCSAASNGTAPAPPTRPTPPSRPATRPTRPATTFRPRPLGSRPTRPRPGTTTTTGGRRPTISVLPSVNDVDSNDIDAGNDVFGNPNDAFSNPGNALTNQDNALANPGNAFTNPGNTLANPANAFANPGVANNGNFAFPADNSVNTAATRPTFGPQQRPTAFNNNRFQPTRPQQQARPGSFAGRPASTNFGEFINFFNSFVTGSPRRRPRPPTQQQQNTFQTTGGRFPFQG